MNRLKMSQFGVMSVLYQQYSLDYCLDSLAANGFRYVDFWGGATHYCAFDTPSDERKKRVREIRKMMDDRGLKMSVFTAEQICLYPINVASSNPYVRRNSMDIVKQYLEDTKEFGADYYFAQMGYGLFDEDKKGTVKRAIESLCQMVEYAKEIGVKMVMEQLQPYECNICYDKKTLNYLIDAVDSSYLTACVDCVAAAAAGESPLEYYDTFGVINHVHLADGEPTGHMCPGDGSNPLNDYLKILADRNYQGSVTLEINNQMYFDNPDKAVQRAARWLRENPYVESGE